MTLVKNGQIVLDGTINKTEKEKIVFRLFELYEEFIDICKNIEPNIALVIESKGDYEMYKWFVARDFRQYHKSLDGFDNWCKCYLLDERDFYICCEVLEVKTEDEIH